MGLPISKEIPSSVIEQFDSFVSASTTLLKSTTQSCASSASNIQNITVVNFIGDIDIRKIVWRQWANVDLACLQSANGTELQQSMAEIANDAGVALTDAIVDAIKVEPGDPALASIVNYVAEVSTFLSDSYIQTCVSEAKNEQSITVRDGEGSLTIELIQFDQATESASSCAQVDANSTDAAQALWDSVYKLTDSPTKKQLQSLNWIVPLIFVIVFVVLLAVLRWKVIVSPVFYSSFFSVVFLFFAIAFVYLGWPYKRNAEQVGLFPEFRDQYNAFDKSNQAMMIGFAIAAAICVLGLIVAIALYPYEKAWSQKLRTQIRKRASMDQKVKTTVPNDNR